MPSKFLEAFADALIAALDEQQLIAIAPGARLQVVHFVATRLEAAGNGTSLISTLSMALIAAPEVEELFADDDTLRELVTDLPRDRLPRGRS